MERPDGLTDTTADVLARFRAPDAPDEVFLLDTYYPGGGPGHAVEITVRRGEAELRWYERRPDRYFARPVSPQELDALRRFVISRGTDRLPPRELAGFDGIEHVYVHALPHAAYHVLINNPGEDGGVYTELVAWFDRLADPARLRVRYTGRQLPNGAEVLWASPVDEVSGVHAAGEDIRVFVGRRGSTEGSWRSLTPTGLGDEVEPPVSRPAGPPGTASSRRVNAGRNYAWHDVSTDRMYVVADGNLFRVPASRFAHAEWDW